MKSVVNVGLGEDLVSSNVVQIVTRDLQAITGQKPIERKAKKSIANFKLREGQIIGLTVTLRGYNMWHFLDRLLNIALPRVRDFRGVSSKSFDGNGNYSLGLTEQVIFPEIDYNEIDKLRGMQINIVTSSDSDIESRKMLELLGMPFENPKPRYEDKNLPKETIESMFAQDFTSSSGNAETDNQLVDYIQSSVRATDETDVDQESRNVEAERASVMGDVELESPVEATPNTGQQVSAQQFQTLFPNDPTGAAIAQRRRNA